MRETFGTLTSIALELACFKAGLGISGNYNCSSLRFARFCNAPSGTDCFMSTLFSLQEISAHGLSRIISGRRYALEF